MSLIMGFLFGSATALIAVSDSRTGLEIECLQNKQAANLFNYIIKQHLANYRDLGKMFPDEDWNMHANNLEELYDEVLYDVECHSNYVVTTKMLYNNYNSIEVAE